MSRGFNGVDQLVAVHRVDQGLGRRRSLQSESRRPARSLRNSRARVAHQEAALRAPRQYRTDGVFSQISRSSSAASGVTGSGLRFLPHSPGLFLLAFVFRQVLCRLEDLLDTREKRCLRHRDRGSERDSWPVSDQRRQRPPPFPLPLFSFISAMKLAPMLDYGQDPRKSVTRSGTPFGKTLTSTLSFAARAACHPCRPEYDWPFSGYKLNSGVPDNTWAGGSIAARNAA